MERWTELSQVFCLAIDGLGSKDFLEHRDGPEAAALDAILQHQLEFVSPSHYDSTLAETLSALPMSNRRKKNLRKEFGGTEKLLQSGNAFHTYR